MSELRSKCCGAKVIEYHYSYIKGNRGLIEYECEKCKKKPTEVEEIEEGNNDQNEQFLEEGPSRVEEGDK